MTHPVVGCWISNKSTVIYIDDCTVSIVEYNILHACVVSTSYIVYMSDCLSRNSPSNICCSSLWLESAGVHLKQRFWPALHI